MKALLTAIALTMVTTAASAITVCSPVRSEGITDGKINYDTSNFYRNLDPIKLEIPEDAEDKQGGKLWTSTNSYGTVITNFYFDGELIEAVTSIMRESNAVISFQYKYNCSDFD